jgi:hypothetical protein
VATVQAKLRNPNARELKLKTRKAAPQAERAREKARNEKDAEAEAQRRREERDAMKSDLANQTDDPKARAKQYKDDKKG